MQNFRLDDISKKDGLLIELDIHKDLKPVPHVKIHDHDWTPWTPEQEADFCATVDTVSMLQIPVPKSKEEEDALVEKFLNGFRKLLTEENNWTFLPMLETSLEYCAQCNSCSDACHLYEATNNNEYYRPNFRSEVFRRIYKLYIKKEPFAKLRYGDFELNFKTISRLAELAYRCNLCRRCSQVCPISIDNGLIAREIRKLFSQEFGWYPKELHERGSMFQLEKGSSTGMTGEVCKESIEFIDEDFSEETGFEFQTPWDVEGADILLIHNAGEVIAWPDNIAAFSIIFEKAGLSWTLSSDLAAYDSINYGVFYDDAQFARTALLHAQAAAKLGVKKIVMAECGHAHKALTVIADRVLPEALNVPRESCFPILRDLVLEGKLKLDPSRNNFPVTLHDPCNIARLMGISKPQRDVLHAIAPQFREMHPHGAENYCCGGGSGFAIMTRNDIEPWRMMVSGRKKIEQIANAFADCLDPSIKKYVCAPCSNCKGQIREILDIHKLSEEYNIHYGGLVELIVNCMVDIEPGFLKFGDE